MLSIQLKSRLFYSIGLLFSYTLQASSGGSIVVDTTAGSTIKVMQQGKTFAIQGGTVQASNLLHSFQEFNIEQGQTADFQAAPNTQNIISRVTGPNDSWINGKIQSTTSQADLYLINPNGIMFGANASLSVNGAFHASTADYIELTDGTQVYADSNQGVTLTVSAPEAFGFLGKPSSNIQIDDSSLSVKSGKTLSLIGGSIEATSDALLNAEGGHINLIAVSSAGKIQPTIVNPTNQTQGEITLNNSRVIIDTTTGSNTVGTINIQGGQVALTNSSLQAHNNSTLDADHEGIHIIANNIQLADSSISARPQSSGKGSSINLQANGTIEFQDSAISMYANNAGDAGTLEMHGENIHFIGNSKIEGQARGTGNAPSISLTANNQALFQKNNEANDYNGIFVKTESKEPNGGTSGRVIINAKNIKFEDSSGISTGSLGTGDSNTVSLQAEDISFTNSGISTYTQETGQGGSVDIQANGAVKFQDSNINIYTYKSGNAGTLTIDAHDIHFIGDARIYGTAGGTGNAASVHLIANNDVFFIGNSEKQTNGDLGILVQTHSKDLDGGNSGHVAIKAKNIKFENNTRIWSGSLGTGNNNSISLKAENIHFKKSGGISTYAQGVGQGGAIDLHASETVEFEDSGINIYTYASGNAGTLTIEAHDIRFIGDARIYGTAGGTGNAASVHLIAKNQVLFTKDIKNNDYNGIVVKTNDTGPNGGKAGNITIQAKDIRLENTARIWASSQGSGEASSIILDADNIHFGEKNSLSVAAYGSGDSGSVLLRSNNIIEFKGGDILSTTFSGSSSNVGELTIQAKDIHFIEGAQIIAKNNSSGKAGVIKITATGDVIFQGKNGSDYSGIFINTQGKQKTGSEGRVNIQANNIRFLNGGRIETQTSGASSAGQLNLHAIDTIQLVGQNTYFQLRGSGGGSAGDIQIQANKLILDDQPFISSTTSSSGNAGSITVNVNEFIMKRGAKLTSSTSGTGHAGRVDAQKKPILGIFINSKYLTIENNSSITSESTNTGLGGNAGIVQIDVSDSFLMGSGSAIKTSTSGQGNAGDILIGTYTQPKILHITGGSSIESDSRLSSTQAGISGNLVIRVGKFANIQDSSILTAASNSIDGGSIRIATTGRLRLQDSQITTSVTSGLGQGGNITTNSIFTVIENSRVQANAYGGPGGNVDIQSDYQLLFGNNTIEASSALSTSGQVNLSGIEFNKAELIATTETVPPLDTTSWRPVPCHLRRGGISRLIMASYDAHPTPVDDISSSLPIWVQQIPTKLRTTPSPSIKMPTIKPTTTQYSHHTITSNIATGCDS